MNHKVLFLSVHPQYADKILKGTKTVELRRSYPRQTTEGSMGLIYASSPVRSVVGAFKVVRVVQQPLKQLWELVKHAAGVSRDEFNAYYQGLSVGVGIYLTDVRGFSDPIALPEIRRRLSASYPPRSFCYPSRHKCASLLKLVHGEVHSGRAGDCAAPLIVS